MVGSLLFDPTEEKPQKIRGGDAEPDELVLAIGDPVMYDIYPCEIVGKGFDYEAGKRFYTLLFQPAPKARQFRVYADHPLLYRIVHALYLAKEGDYWGDRQ